MVDISKLDDPQFIEIDADAITADIVALYEEISGKTLYPAQADRLMIDVIAYREMLIRTSINEAAKQNLLAFANGVMLDYLGDFFGVERLKNETDEQLRTRIRLAPESYATTGSRQAYIYHALSVDASIIDAQAVRRDDNGNIDIYILTADGLPHPELQQAVLDNVSDERKRPLSDLVFVNEPEVVEVEIEIKIYPYNNVDSVELITRKRNELEQLATTYTMQLGKDIVPSQIIDELSEPDIYRIEVITPAVPIVMQPHQIPRFITRQARLGASEDG